MYVVAPVMPLRESRDRAARALELRGARWTWPAIARELGYATEGGARLAVSRLVKSMTGTLDVSTERAVTVAKLDDLDRRLHPHFVAATDSGDSETAVKVSKELRSIADTRSRIGGIAAPQRVEHHVEVSFTDAIGQARQQLLAVENTIDAEIIEDAEEIE